MNQNPSDQQNLIDQVKLTTPQTLLLVAGWLVGSVIAVLLYLTPIGLASICAQSSGFGAWVLYMLWAAITGPFYLVYYLIYRVAMGNKCQ